MSEPLNDLRLEAAAEMLTAWDAWDVCESLKLDWARGAIDAEPDDALAMLTTALRVTGADELAAALGWFLEDPRFQVAVGGNPNAVDQMLADARAALAKYKELKQ